MQSDKPRTRTAGLFTLHPSGRGHDLGKLTLGGLTLAFITYPTVILYFALCVLAGWGAIRLGALQTPLRCAAAAFVCLWIYPLVWYGLHRYMLHGRFLYRWRATAALWKRIHYDHHGDAQRMSVLFGSPSTTLPVMVGITFPVGYLIGGPPAALCMFITSLVVTATYEFCHCVYHLDYTPNLAWLRRGKTLHLAHHYRNETGNYGIISFWPDWLFGTLYRQASERPQSKTVFNLGYDEDAARRYPWVAALTAPAEAASPGGPRADPRP
jgi:sterol desaturase/sphingolipid hydroxylase (fatty acid hydroxylase superfamily)